MLYYILCFIALLLILLKIYTKFNTVWCRCQTCLIGKTAIVTGANTGLGYATALDLAKRGAKLIIAGRNEEQLNEARNKIIKETNNTNIIIRIIDLSSFESVRHFAKTILDTEERLDILCNNAGAAGLANKITEDGHQILMQVNYFSNFLLTNLLADLLKKSAPSRITNVSSLAAAYAKKFDIKNLDFFPGILEVYANSKLCNILFTQECAKRLKDKEVYSYSVHPGVVMTDVFRRVRGALMKKVIRAAGALYFKSPQEGAQTIIHVCVANDIEKHSGDHFNECEYQESYKTARDPNLSIILWEQTVKTLKLDPSEIKI